MTVEIPKSTTVPTGNQRSNANLAPWFEGYRSQTMADAAAGQPKSSRYEKTQEGGSLVEGYPPPVQANIQEPYHRSQTAVENDFISILSGTHIDESPPPRPVPPTDVDAVASQAAAMIEEVLAGGGDAKGLIGELVQNSDTLATLLGELERPQTAANPWSTPQITEHCFCKLLITHKQAGAIIGKNGAEIDAMEKAAHVTAKVSPGGSFFPGTNDRIMVLSGKGHNIRAALNEVVNKFDYCNQVAQAQEDAKLTFLGTTNSFDQVISRPRPIPMVLRMVVPNSSVGTLMGKQGRDIRQLAITCGVHIQISPRLTGVLERVVNITGASHQCMLAGCSIVEVIRHNPHVVEHSNILMYTPYQHRLAAKQAESFRDYHIAANNDSPRESPFDPSPFASTAADCDAASRRGLMSKLLAKKREESPPVVREARSVTENFPPHIAAQERLRRHMRSEIQTNLVKEARVRAARLEKELGPSLLGLGPRAETNLMVQAANSRVTGMPNDDSELSYAAGGPLARETAELYRRLCGDDDDTIQERACRAPEVMMTNDTATAVTMAVPAVISGGSSSSSSNISPDRSSTGDGKPKRGEFGDSTCSESSLRFLAAADIPVPLPALDEQAPPPPPPATAAECEE